MREPWNHDNGASDVWALKAYVGYSVNANVNEWTSCSFFSLLEEFDYEPLIFEWYRSEVIFPSKRSKISALYLSVILAIW